MKAIEKFHRISGKRLRFYENPITIYVWDYRPFLKWPPPDPPVYEYVLHYGDHGETSDETFATEEKACERAFNRALELLELTTKEMHNEKGKIQEIKI